ncbi:MAG: polyprenyl synthetase family protein [Bacteroidota bacterium]
MAITLDEIKAPILSEMEEFETKFRTFMQSHVPLLDKIMHYIVKRKGKQLRPMFVFLSAKICGTMNESSYRAAALIELLHTATLVHDDVVDDSHLRRGFFSLNAIWKNKIAVLVGDYLLSRGLLLAVDNEDYKLLQIVSNAVKEMSEGELLQIEKARRLDVDEKVYFEIIRQKTAVLIASCCSCGAASVGCNKEIIEQMRQFGELTGIAFQIKDDLFDYGTGNKIGKPIGNDIKEKKFTLPLIYALNQSSFFEKRKIIDTIKNHCDDTKKVGKVIDFVNNSGGIEYAVQKMHLYKDKALQMLSSFNNNESKKALEQLVVFTIERKN